MDSSETPMSDVQQGLTELTCAESNARDSAAIGVEDAQPSTAFAGHCATTTIERSNGAGAVARSGRSSSSLSATAKEFTLTGYDATHAMVPASLDLIPDKAHNRGEEDDENEQTSMDTEMQLMEEQMEVLWDTFADLSHECLQVALNKSDWDLSRASNLLQSVVQRPQKGKICDKHSASVP